MSPAPVALEDQDTADLKPELAREQAECERLAGMIWTKIYLSRHTLDGLGPTRLLIIAAALGLDVSKG